MEENRKSLSPISTLPPLLMQFVGLGLLLSTLVTPPRLGALAGSTRPLLLLPLLFLLQTPLFFDDVHQVSEIEVAVRGDFAKARGLQTSECVACLTPEGLHDT